MFTWTDLKTNAEEITLYLFENDAVFEKLANAPGRVYYLHFNSYDDKYLFWFQSPNESTDAEVCRKINEIINLVEPSVDSRSVHSVHNPVSLPGQEGAPAPLTPQALQTAMQSMHGGIGNCTAGLASKLKSRLMSSRFQQIRESVGFGRFDGGAAVGTGEAAAGWTAGA